MCVDAPQPQASSWLAGIAGSLLLILWLAAMALGLATLGPSPSPASAADAMAVEALVAELPRPDTPTAWLRPGCSCTGLPQVDSGQLRARIEAGGFALRELPASALALPYPLIVATADARLLYAGPANWGGSCSGAELLPALLKAALATRRPPLVVASDCTCS